MVVTTAKIEQYVKSNEYPKIANIPVQRGSRSTSAISAYRNVVIVFFIMTPQFSISFIAFLNSLKNSTAVNVTAMTSATGSAV